MGKFSRTWRMMGASWRVLQKDKELLLFPVLSTAAAALVVASFALPLFHEDTRRSLEGADGGEPVLLAGLFVFYLANYFVIIFFNAGIVACALKRMRGGDPTVGSGLRTAWSNLPRIFGWALVAATVGFILRAIEERVGLVGRIVVALLGMTWTVTSFLVVPVLVSEGRGPIDAYKASAAMLKRSWGEQIIGNVGFGLIFMLLGVVPVAVFVLAGMTGSDVAITTALVICVVYIVAIALAQSTLQAIYQAAVYLYASEGLAPEGFDRELLADSFRRR